MVPTELGLSGLSRSTSYAYYRPALLLPAYLIVINVKCLKLHKISLGAYEVKE